MPGWGDNWIPPRRDRSNSNSEDDRRKPGETMEEYKKRVNGGKKGKKGNK